MAATRKEVDQMARLRERIEMQPSDNEDQDDERSTGGESGGESEASGSEENWSGEDLQGQEHDTGQSGAADAANGEQVHINSTQAQSIGERLERLGHGSGPSRRKRRIQNGDQELVSAASQSSRDHPSEGIGGKRSAGRESLAESRTKPHSRANKNRPQEVSSLRAVGRFREVVAGKRNTRRDPRFEGGGGSSKLNYDIFRKAYGFLGTYQDGEIEALKTSLKKEKNQERSGRLQALLTRLQQERAERAQGDRTRTTLREVKKKEREAVAGGKKPYFLKGSEKKRLSLEQRYEGLKEEGKLGKFMEKKRKRNAAKDHRWMPSKRQDRG